jgi:hypothetical protein
MVLLFDDRLDKKLAAASIERRGQFFVCAQ